MATATRRLDASLTSFLSELLSFNLRVARPIELKSHTSEYRSEIETLFGDGGGGGARTRHGNGGASASSEMRS